MKKSEILNVLKRKVKEYYVIEGYPALRAGLLHSGKADFHKPA